VFTQRRDISGHRFIFAVLNNIFVEYGFFKTSTGGKGKLSPSSDDVFYHLNKLIKKDVVWVVNQVDQ